jgi:DNA-binding MarR family transcriptional regulator
MTKPEGTRGSVRVHDATNLLREIREVGAAFEAHLGSQLTVNPTDLEAMEHLIQDGPLTPTELSRRLAVSTAATTTIIDRLTAVGHVSRIPNPADRRGILVVPAPASVDRAMGAIMPMVVGIDRVLASYTDEEKSVITDYLAQVVAVYRSHLPEEQARD